MSLRIKIVVWLAIFLLTAAFPFVVPDAVVFGYADFLINLGLSHAFNLAQTADANSQETGRILFAHATASVLSLVIFLWSITAYLQNRPRLPGVSPQLRQLLPWLLVALFGAIFIFAFPGEVKAGGGAVAEFLFLLLGYGVLVALSQIGLSAVKPR